MLDGLEVRGRPVTTGSFNELFETEYRSLVALAFVFAQDRSEAEELVQETFEAAFRRWDAISGYDEPSQWLRRVLLNRCTSRGRRRTSESRANARLLQRPAVDPAALSTPDPELVAALRRLPRRQAEVVALHYVDDLTIDAVAGALGVSASTTKTHLRRALRTLRRELAGERSQADG